MFLKIEMQKTVDWRWYSLPMDTDETRPLVGADAIDEKDWRAMDDKKKIKLHGVRQGPGGDLIFSTKVWLFESERITYQKYRVDNKKELQEIVGLVIEETGAFDLVGGYHPEFDEDNPKQDSHPTGRELVVFRLKGEDHHTLIASNPEGWGGWAYIMSDAGKTVDHVHFYN